MYPAVMRTVQFRSRLRLPKVRSAFRAGKLIIRQMDLGIRVVSLYTFFAIAIILAFWP